MKGTIKSSGIMLQPQSSDDLLLVEDYGDGGFRLRGHRVEGTTLVLEGGFYPVEAQTLAALDAASFDRILGLDTRPDILLIGTGARMQLLPGPTRQFLNQAGIGFDLMDTGAAARTYNVLLMEGRRVAALLLPVD